MLRRDQADVRHQVTGGSEATEVTDLGDHGDRGQLADAAEHLQGPDHAGVSAVPRTRREDDLEALLPLRAAPDGTAVLIEHDAFGGAGEVESLEPAVVTHRGHAGPDGPVQPADHQEGVEPMPIARQIGMGVGASSDQVAQGFVILIGHPDGIEVAAAQQAGELERIAAVGLHPLVGPPGDLPWSHHYPAVDAERGQLPLHPVPGGASLVGNVELAEPVLHAGEELAHSSRVVGDHPQRGRRFPVIRRKGRGDARLVHIQTDVRRTFMHGPAPHMWLGAITRWGRATHHSCGVQPVLPC
jgi:hypothetical protein